MRSCVLICTIHIYNQSTLIIGAIWTLTDIFGCVLSSVLVHALGPFILIIVFDRNQLIFQSEKF
jgi:hypothetical protein